MDGFITIGTKLDTKQFDKQIELMEQKAAELEQQLEDPKSIGLSSREVDEINVELEKTKNKIIQLRKEKAKAEQPQGLKQLKTGIDNFGSGLQKAVNRVGKLVLGIFGIRTAFMALRRASSELASYNEEYGANLEYIRFALTQAIAPVLEYIVNLAMKLLAYINAIAQAWFGVNLFENASVDNFAKMKKGVGGVTNAVKELKKQLAGFDEINVLQEDGSVRTGGGGGGIALPTMDLKNIQDIEIPEWVRWIINHKTEVLGIITALGAALLGIKIGAFVNGLLSANAAMGGFLTQIGKIVAGAALIAGGFALIITGSHNIVSGWAEMTTQEKLVQVALVALGGAMVAFGLMMLGASGPVAAILALIAVLGTLLISEHLEKGNILDLVAAEERLQEAKKNSIQAYNSYVNAVDRAEEAQKDLDEAQRKTGLSGEELNRLVKEGALDYQNMNSAQREVYKAYLNNLNAQEELAEATQNVADANREEIITEWEKKLAVDANAGAYDEFKKSVIEAWEAGELKTDEARQLIEESMQKMGQISYDTFLEDIPNEIKEGLNPARYQSILQMLINMFANGLENFGYSVKRWWDTLWGNIWSTLQNPGEAFQKGMNYLFGQEKGAIVYNGAPKLAVGGIINQPGRGIPIGRAIAGERGAEGVIPLTDSQQMEILGEAIGRYITINATIPVSMNSRLISREVKQVQADQDFAYNM